LQKILCNKCQKNLKTPTCKITCEDEKKRKWQSFEGLQICPVCTTIMISGNSVKDIILVAKENEKQNIPVMRMHSENDANGITLLTENSS